jgi:hypothetical protein
MKKKPTRLFRRPELPEIPPEADKLREAHRVIDPERIYCLELPDGSLGRWTGEQLLETARNMVALIDAQRAGDERGMRDAVERILGEDASC